MVKPRTDSAGGEMQHSLRLEAVMAQHETLLLRYAARIVRDSAAAEDVVQNVFIKLFRSWNGAASPTANLRGWLYRATHNEAVDHVRREVRLRLLHERQADEPAATTAAPLPVHALEERDRLALVLKHLGRLDPPEQQVLLLRLQEGLSYRDIAEITGRTEGNVGNILHHAVKKIAKVMVPHVL